MSEVAGGEGGMEMQDPAALFGSLFGGERFKDLIGEISLVKGEWDWWSGALVWRVKELNCEWKQTLRPRWTS